MQKRYNRIWAVLLWAVLLTGCAEHTDAEPMLTETEQVTESTVLPETTESFTSVNTEQNPDETLCVNEDSIYGSRRTTYGWKQGELVPVRLRDEYWRHGSTVTDTYEYAQDGQKILVQREIRETDGNRSEIIEYPLYFRILPDTVQVLQNAEIVQELELGSFWESYAALGAYFEQQMESPTMPLEGAYLREPEQYLGTEDYDFDGHWDLYIPDTMQGECVGNYYRFSPETGRFEQWDELNAIGFEMYTDPENGTLNAYTGGEFRRWKWQDGGLVLTDEASR
ncbi:MAG: hypothetical protein II341_00115 [Oscillospiraceae bacterium]|nr:hypothetical protein [Oscillospiraceae bacterium]